MEASIGADWQKFFDLTCVASMKAMFWQDPTDGPHPPNRFITMDKSVPNYCGPENTHETLNSEDHYIMGNAKDIELYFAKKLGKTAKFVYIGDSYVSDCLRSQERENWESIVVVEELNKEWIDSGIKTNEETTLFAYEKYWGSFFTDEIKGETVQTAWAALAERLPYSVSMLSDLARMTK
jgi:hypothetical protein